MARCVHPPGERCLSCRRSGLLPLDAWRFRTCFGSCTMLLALHHAGCRPGGSVDPPAERPLHAVDHGLSVLRERLPCSRYVGRALWYPGLQRSWPAPPAECAAQRSVLGVPVPPHARDAPSHGDDPRGRARARPAAHGGADAERAPPRRRNGTPLARPGLTAALPSAAGCTPCP